MFTSTFSSVSLNHVGPPSLKLSVTASPFLPSTGYYNKSTYEKTLGDNYYVSNFIVSIIKSFLFG